MEDSLVTSATTIKESAQISRSYASGLPVDEIAQMYGLEEADVMDAVMYYLSQAHLPLTKEAHRRILETRLDMYRNALWKKGMKGSASAVQTLLKVEELGMKLHGLNMGTKAQQDYADALRLQAEVQARALAVAVSRTLEDADVPIDARMKVLAALEGAQDEMIDDIAEGEIVE